MANRGPTQSTPRGASASTPLDPSQLSAQKLLRDLPNILGKHFNPSARYSLLNKRHDSTLLGERLTDGWKLVIDDVPGDGSADTFALISKVEG